MHSSATLPMMLPLRMRNRSELDTLRAQEHYAPFRPTPFSADNLDEATNRGPGALFRDEWNSLATRAQEKNISLYKSHRDITPTIPPAVDATYNANEVSDIALQINKKGNVATMLKSPTPRFSTEEEDACIGSKNGPGTYSPERFIGAFPILSEHITPSIVREEKRRAHQDFERAFAILPTASKSNRSVEPSSHSGLSGKFTTRLRSPTLTPELLPHTTGTSDSNGLQGLHSAPLKPALTPKNVYSHRANRELVLQRTKS